MSNQDKNQDIDGTKEENTSETKLVNSEKEGEVKNELNKDGNSNQVEKPKRKKGDQYLVKRIDQDKIDFKNLTEEQKSEIKPQLEEEQELAIGHKWESYDHIRMANDDDPDDLFDENNQKLKGKLKVIGIMMLGGLVSYYTKQTWIFFVFQIAALFPFMFETFTTKESYDSYIVPNKKAYFSNSNVSFGFKIIGKGRCYEQDPSLYPKAQELYEYFKETQQLIRSLRPSKNAKKNN